MRAMLLVLGLLLTVAPASALIPGEWTGDGNNLDLGVLQPGDIILCRGCAGWLEDKFGNIIGHWHHAAMYIGNGQMVEAWKDGMRVVSVDMVKNADDCGI